MLARFMRLFSRPVPNRDWLTALEGNTAAKLKLAANLP